MNYKVLVVDDEEAIRKLIQSRLSRDGFDVATAAGFDEAYTIFGNGTQFSCVVTDLRMTGKDGFALIDYFKKKSPSTRFILITGHGNKDAAVQAIKVGATDYLEKPFELDDLYHSVRRAHREYTLELENKDLMSRLEARLEKAEARRDPLESYTSVSPAMGKVQEWLNVLKRESVRTEAEEPTVLILGESGTGKELVARQVHERSRRTQGPWVAVNCANFNEQLLESELFGHERGAFTGAATAKRGLLEIARGGTLFLDEIGEMDVKSQAKLLRVIQEKSYRRLGGTADLTSDVRIVAATHDSLGEKVATGKFREDLYHRISKVVVDVPSLRDRREDVLPMSVYFAQRAFKSREKEFPGFAPDAEEALRSYRWPGNVRELVNVLERVALIYTPGAGSIQGAMLGLPRSGNASNVIAMRPKLSVVDGGKASAPQASQPARAFDFDPTVGYMELKKRWVDSFEQEYLSDLLNKHHGNVSAAAREARLDRSNFLRLLRRHEIKAAIFRGETAASVEAEAPVTSSVEESMPDNVVALPKAA